MHFQDTILYSNFMSNLALNFDFFLHYWPINDLEYILVAFVKCLRCVIVRVFGGLRNIWRSPTLVLYMHINETTEGWLDLKQKPGLRYHGGDQMTKAIASMPPGHCLGALQIAGLELHTGHGGGLCCPLVFALVPLQKFPIDLNIFQWKCPLQSGNGLALSKMKSHAWNTPVENYNFLIGCPLLKEKMHQLVPLSFQKRSIHLVHSWKTTSPSLLIYILVTWNKFCSSINGLSFMYKVLLVSWIVPPDVQ